MSRVRCVVLAAVGLFAHHAFAQGQPGIWKRQFVPPAPVQVVIEPMNGTFAAGSPELGLLRAPSLTPLYDHNTPCLVQTQFKADKDGFDIGYTVTNPTSAPVAVPGMVMGGLQLDTHTEYLSHAFGCSFIELATQGNGAINTPTGVYPDALYSPLMVLRDGTVAVGLSLEYPVLEYKQSVKVSAARWPGASDWTAYFFVQGKIPAGATRTYTMSLRFAHPGDWIYTVHAYREYFWSMYGNQTRYVQDRRPVFGMSMSSQSFFSPTNPRGFDPMLRPDLNGWKGTVDSILQNAVANGYRRIMMWTPSGHYWQNYGNNFAPQFMSAWTAPMAQTASQFGRVTDAGAQMCFWWGHSGRVADRWEDDHLDPFDPWNLPQRITMLTEWGLAVARGADGAGLDGFEELPLWSAIPWLEMLLWLKPDAFLIAEAACADVMHLWVPFWIQGNDLPTPHLLADYLVPAREIWVHLVDDDINTGRVNEVNSWGMTVCIIGASAIQPTIQGVVLQFPGGGGGP